MHHGVVQRGGGWNADGWVCNNFSPIGEANVHGPVRSDAYEFAPNRLDLIAESTYHVQVPYREALATYCFYLRTYPINGGLNQTS